MQRDKDSELQSQKGYHKLILWKKGKGFVKRIYQETETFPRAEIFGLQSQIRRASISFLLNIVEGQRRKTKKDFLKFLNIADGSLSEVEACLENESFKELEYLRRELAAMLHAFTKRVKESNSVAV